MLADANTCAHFNTIFLDLDPNFKPKRGALPVTRLTSLLRLLPNEHNNWFIGLEQSINGVKGIFFNPQLDGHFALRIPSTGRMSKKNTQKAVDAYNNLGMALQLMDQPPMQDLWGRGQNAMYAGFKKFDDIWAQKGVQPVSFASVSQELITINHSTI